MTTAIDTNILLDILIPDPAFVEASIQKLERSADKGKLIICDIVYTELASQFDRIFELNKFLSDTKIELVYSNKHTLFEASRFWNSYLKKKSTQRYYCPQCGKQINQKCGNCNYPLTLPRRALNDFIIGAHAMAFADYFITRDRGFYRKYFKDLQII